MQSVSDIRNLYHALFSMKNGKTVTSEEIQAMPFDEWIKWASQQMGKAEEDGR